MMINLDYYSIPSAYSAPLLARFGHSALMKFHTIIAAIILIFFHQRRGADDAERK